MTAVERRFGPSPRRVEMIPPDTSIEIWVRSLGRWSGGFELVEWAGDRCWVRRSGDPSGGVLPELFRADDVREHLAPQPGTIGRHLRHR